VVGSGRRHRRRPVTGTTFGHVCRIERPLHSIRSFLDALALITETLDEPGASAVNVIVHATLDQVGEIDEEYSALFQLSHPNREHFEREAWLTDKAD
jgi:hypothetical protein